MYRYYIPGFFQNRNTNLQLLAIMKDCPDIFYNDFEIGSIFDNFPNVTWNGGSVLVGESVSLDGIRKFADAYNAYGIPLRLTMTNRLIEERDLYDRYANAVMKELHDGYNQVLVASPILEEYIRSEYPKFPIVKSICGTDDTPYDDSDKYIMSVLKKSKNKDFEFLETIERKDKIEILCNEFCVKNCPRQYSHYEDYNKVQLWEEKIYLA